MFTELPLDKTWLLRFNQTNIFQISNQNIICFEKGMAIDADGHPFAYHPDNIGLDDLKHGGYDGNWWGVATEDEKTSGEPLIQRERDPAPGYFLSTTSLINREFPYDDARRYVDAAIIPYFVLPELLLDRVSLGDIAWIVNRETGLGSFAIFADVGPDVGEGSMRLADKLGIDSNPRTGGADSGVLYFIFCGSGNGNGFHLTESEINQTGNRVQRLCVYEPSLLTGDRTEYRGGERFFSVLMKLIDPLLFGGWKKYRSVAAANVARTMVQLSHHDESGKFIIRFGYTEPFIVPML